MTLAEFLTGRNMTGFLTARLDEDQAAATAAVAHGPWCWAEPRLRRLVPAPLPMAASAKTPRLGGRGEDSLKLRV